MRRALLLFIAAALLPAFLFGSSAFSASTTGGRTLTVALVGDALGYLAVAANPASPHACFAPEQTSPASEDGKLVIDFGSAAGCAGGTGTGINPGDTASKRARYAFHDLLKVTNKGTRNDVLVWVNVTGAGSTIHVAKNAASGQMTDSDSVYYAASATPLTLDVGESGYVGVRLSTTTLSSGTLSGTVTFDARRS